MWSSSAWPDAGSAPISARIRVVLPAPLRPMRPHIWPSFTVSVAPRMIGTGPIETSRFLTLSMVVRPCGGPQLHIGDQLLHLRIAQSLLRRAVGNDGPVVEGEHAVSE